MRSSPDSVGSLRLNIPISFAAISFVLTLGATLAFHWIPQVTPGQKWQDSLTFLIQAASAAATTAGAFYALRAIALNANQQGADATVTSQLQLSIKKTDRALEFISLWDAPHYAKARETVRQIAANASSTGLTKAEVVSKYLHERADSEQDIVVLLNLLEKVALVIYRDLADESLMYDFYHSIVNQAWEHLSGYVYDTRKKRGDRSVYKLLEDLQSNWKNKVDPI
jgi:hypothetical protein